MQTESEKNQSMKNKIVLGIIGVLFIVAYFTTAQDNIVNIDPIEDYFVEVARGNVQGQSAVNKFGANYDIGTVEEVVWDGGGDYNWLENATVLQVSSSDVDDTYSGTGGWDLMLQGLDENWEEYTEIINLSGQTAVNTTGQFIRIFRVIGLHSGSTGSNEGDIYISTGAVVSGVPSDTTQIYAKVLPDHGQSLMALYTVPAGKEAYLLQGYITSDGAKPASAHYYNRLSNDGNPSKNTKFDFDFTNHFIFSYAIPQGAIPEKTDLWVGAHTSTGTSKISAGFDILLIDT